MTFLCAYTKLPHNGEDVSVRPLAGFSALITGWGLPDPGTRVPTLEVDARIIHTKRKQNVHDFQGKKSIV
jgi:hypothetical protein